MEQLKKADEILTRFEKLIRARRYIINRDEIEAYQTAAENFNKGEVDIKNLRRICGVIYDCTEEYYTI